MKLHKTRAGWRVITPALGVLAITNAAKADPIADAVTELGTLATSVGGGATALLSIAVVFVGVKLAKRLLNKA